MVNNHPGGCEAAKDIDPRKVTCLVRVRTIFSKREIHFQTQALAPAALAASLPVLVPITSEQARNLPASRQMARTSCKTLEIAQVNQDWMPQKPRLSSRCRESFNSD